MPSGVLSKLSFRGTKLAPLLSKTAKFSRRRYLSMAAPSSNAVFGDIHVVDDLVSACAGNGVESFKPSGVFLADRSASNNWLRSSLKMRKAEVGITRMVCGFSSFDAVRKNCGVNGLVTGPLLRNFHTSLHVCYAAGPAPDVSFEGSSAENAMVSGQTLKLLSGSCYLPHPAKEETGGEDAHFICEDEHIIGVADGVGGWADVGINAGLYSRELMSNSVSAIQEEPKDSIDPARVLEKAHSITKAKGSSTACIIALRKEGLQAINLGDSGFIVVRDGCTIFQSPVQQHDFNFTFQLDSTGQGDLPSAGQVFTIPVASGDAIVVGTDGLFDNLYNNEVTAILVHAIRARLGPQAAAQKIAALARERAQDRNRQTPFSTAAQEAGIRYYGGKPDDITVVVSYVANSSHV